MAPSQQPCLLPRSVYLTGLTGRAREVSATPQRAPVVAAAAMEGGSGFTNLVIGPLLQCAEAATLGMPFEARARPLRRRGCFRCAGDASTRCRARCGRRAWGAFARRAPSKRSRTCTLREVASGTAARGALLCFMRALEQLLQLHSLQSRAA